MSAETLLTAARRVVRFVRINDQHDGGLLTIETIKANEILAQMVEDETKRQKNERSADPRDDGR